MNRKTRCLPTNKYTGSESKDVSETGEERKTRKKKDKKKKGAVSECFQKITSSFNPCIEDLPENVMADIISRLPVKKIIHCKSVCKNWREIVSDSYFINLHLSRTPRCVIVHHKMTPESDSYNDVETGNPERPGVLNCLEIEGELNTSHLHHDIVTTLDLTVTPIFKNTTRIIQVGSVDGLLCLWQYSGKVGNTYVCNPITREYVILPRPEYTGSVPMINSYGFGVGLLTKQYKVIWMFRETGPTGPRSLTSSLSYLFEAEVCTVGTSQWRRLGRVPYFINSRNGLFLNGCVHWIVNDKHSPEKLCSFNIDNETFELFPSPPSKEIEDGDYRYKNLGVLNGLLSLSYSSSLEDEFTIWVMKEYGFMKSWCKEVVMKPSLTPAVGWWLNTSVELIESLDDGTILMLSHQNTFLVYCPRKKTIERRAFYRPYVYSTGRAYRPSFLKLQASQSERLHVF